MANEVVNRQVNIFIESGEAQKAYDVLLAKRKSLEEKLKLTTDPKVTGQLNKELKKLEEPISRAAKKVSGELSPSFKDLQTTVNSLAARLRRMSSQDADYSKVLVQYHQANIALKEQKNNIDAIANAQKNIGKSAGIGTFFGTLGANLLTNAIAQLKSLGAQAFQSALETEGVKIAFDRLNQPDLLDNLRKATKGTVTDLELMKRAVAANNFQIPLQNLGTLLEFAQRRARETGQSVDYLVDSIVTGIARKSPLILDNLGINITRINDKFRQTGDFAQAAFEVVNEELEKAGPALEIAADKVDRFKTAFSNMLTDVGSGLISIGENIYESLVVQFGSVGDRAELLVEKANQRIAKENEEARKQELSQIEDFRQRYATADLKGREKIREQAKVQFDLLNKDEAFAAFQGITRLSELLKIRMGVWQKYLGELNVAMDGNDTITNLQKELQLVTEIRNNAIIGSKQFNDAQKRIKELQDRLDSLLGQKKVKDNLFDKFLKEVKDQAKDLDYFNAQQIDKELRANQVKYDRMEQQLIEAYKKRQLTEDQLGQLLLKNAENRGREENLIIQRWAKEVTKNLVSEEKKRQDILDQLYLSSLQKQADFQQKVAEQLAESADRALSKRRFKQEVDLMYANGWERLKIRLEQIEDERTQELANAEKTNKAVTDINRKYDKLAHDAKIEALQETLNQYIDFVSRVNGILSNIFSLQNDRDQAELEALRAKNEQKKKLYENDLNNKVISQKEYNRKVAQLDKEVEQKEKQAKIREFNRQKISKLAEAAINVATAVTAALKEGPIYAAAIAALGAIEIGFIAAQKPPKFGRGGKLRTGKLHSQGGMPIIDPSNGQKVAEIEKGEGVVNRHTMADKKQYNISGTPSQIISWLNARGGGIDWEGGAVMRPEWRDSYVPMVNMAGIQKHMQKIKFAQGGVFGQQSTQADTISPVLEMLTIAVNNLNGQVSNGIKAYTVLSEHNKQQERLDNLVNDVTMR